MARVYLETSFFSACVSTRLDIESQYWQRESLAWLQSQGWRHDLFVSAEVVAELSHASYPRSADALSFVAGLLLVDISPEVLGLARILIDEKVMPGPVAGDAIHVAAAAYHQMEYLLTWNVKHLANPNKRLHLMRVCMRLGLTPPEITTPGNLWVEDE